MKSTSLLTPSGRVWTKNMDNNSSMSDEERCAVKFEEDVTVAGENSRRQLGVVAEVQPADVEIEKAEQVISDTENAIEDNRDTGRLEFDQLSASGNANSQLPALDSSGDDKTINQLPTLLKSEPDYMHETDASGPQGDDSDISSLLPTLEEIVAAKASQQQFTANDVQDRHYDVSPSTQSTEVRECETETVLQYQREISRWRGVVIGVVRQLRFPELLVPDRLCDDITAHSTTQKLCAEIDRIMATKVLDVGTGSASEGPASQPAAGEESVAALEPQWEELVEEAGPEPSYDLDSPVISHLLSTWTTDRAKADFVRCWVRSLYDPHYEAIGYPPGLQVNNLSCVLKDGFAIMLVPLVRKLSKYPLEVHIRRHLRVADPAGTISSPAVEDIIDDPFALEESALYDLRIKRTDLTITAPVGDASTLPRSEGAKQGHALHHPDPVPTLRSRSDDGVAIAAAGGVSHASGSRANRPRLDSSDDYYSPLSEINSFLPVIAAQTRRRVNEPYDPHVHVHRAAPPLRREVNPLGGPAPPYHPDADHTVVNPAPPSVAATPAATQAPSILHSLFGWWGPAAPAPADSQGSAMAVSTAQTAEAATTGPPKPKLGGANDSSAPSVRTEPQHASGDSIVSTMTGTVNAEESRTAAADGRQTPASTTLSGKSLSLSAQVTSPVPPSAPSPMNKIAERLQQIREQKQQYQAKRRPSASSSTDQPATGST